MRSGTDALWVRCPRACTAALHRSPTIVSPDGVATGSSCRRSPRATGRHGRRAAPSQRSRATAPTACVVAPHNAATRHLRRKVIERRERRDRLTAALARLRVQRHQARGVILHRAAKVPVRIIDESRYQAAGGSPSSTPRNQPSSTTARCLTQPRQREVRRRRRHLSGRGRDRRPSEGLLRADSQGTASAERARHRRPLGHVAASLHHTHRVRFRDRILYAPRTSGIPFGYIESCGVIDRISGTGGWTIGRSRVAADGRGRGPGCGAVRPVAGSDRCSATGQRRAHDRGAVRSRRSTLGRGWRRSGWTGGRGTAPPTRVRPRLRARTGCGRPSRPGRCRRRTRSRRGRRRTRSAT